MRPRHRSGHTESAGAFQLIEDLFARVWDANALPARKVDEGHAYLSRLRLWGVDMLANAADGTHTRAARFRRLAQLVSVRVDEKDPLLTVAEVADRLRLNAQRCQTGSRAANCPRCNWDLVVYGSDSRT